MYMDDFLMLVSSEVEALGARGLATRVLVGLGIKRNEKKGHLEPTQLVEHMGWSLEASSVCGTSRVSVSSGASGENISQGDTLCDLRQAGLRYESEAQKSGVDRRGMVARATGSKPVEWAEDLAQPHESQATHRLLPVRLGLGVKPKVCGAGVLVRLRHLHMTHLELEAAHKTVTSLSRELEGKLARLYCDNQTVGTMPNHFTSRNPVPMRRMQRLWIRLD
ncbi:hypothetical protein CYMTET_51250 [Cymbomonas tetramitiformis]|uniref:Reverse transcriptase domain-containing protein n=1 Tax=Cymbomonas tetramitiformis TaxID=36881 RepID=A0AAE0ESB8_9CHLO|nr:hypothetical protein CYMTET_51250 [Cymbomonas tetramitiformis]